MQRIRIRRDREREARSEVQEEEGRVLLDRRGGRRIGRLGRRCRLFGMLCLLILDWWALPTAFWEKRVEEKLMRMRFGRLTYRRILSTILSILARLRSFDKLSTAKGIPLF
jgi:hypothetical protein